jgi:LysR family transcriptional regulator, glycine cleavage system transcriptional activator
MQMLPHLPSTQALRVLDAAVRTRSFTQAALELGLTHGAVSQQIRTLEDRLGERLFDRRGGEMRPTATALAIASSTRHALHIIGEAFAKPAARVGARARLRLATSPAIARFWLAPRLQELAASAGASVISIDARTEPVDVGAGEADAAVRFGPGEWPNVNARLLGYERIFPVASPALARALAPRDPADVVRGRLIANAFMSWSGWLKAARLPAATPLNIVLETSDSNVSLEAAIAGAGVALTRARLARSAIANGQLVPLSDISSDDGHAYYFVWPAGGRAKAVVTAARNWFEAAFAEETAALDLPPIP